MQYRVKEVYDVKDISWIGRVVLNEETEKKGEHKKQTINTAEF